MFNIIIQKFKEQFKSIIYYFVGLFAYAWMIVGLYPSIKKIDLEKLYATYPKEMLKFFGANDMLSLSKFEGFISMEFLSLFFILIISFYVAASAGSTIAGSIERKTIEFQLSQPISRIKLVLSEAFVSLFYTLALIACSSLSMYGLTKIYDVDVSVKGFLAFFVVATAFLWAIYGISIFISSLLKTKITVAAATLSIVMGFYVFTAMTNMVDKLKNYDKLSLFYTYNPQKLLETGTVDWTHVEILLGILILGLVSSLIVFNNKDL
ncbi:MAG: ABC transporter permease [Patescibacteria group bacterium]|nr:ABC transporter permease [Patescibacteria group bacterium]